MQSTPISQCGNRFEFDVLVLGSGIAGLSYVLDLLELRPQTKIALITKKDIRESNSHYAQGGIASVSLPEDSIEMHIEDTLSAGAGLCNSKAVRTILASAPERIASLLKRGVNFSQNEKHLFDLGMEGGHSHRRIFRAGDQTGAEIIRALTSHVCNQKSVALFENHTAVNLITQVEKHSPSAAREVIGAYVLDEKMAVIHTFLARAVVLATGGAGKIYRYTTNPETATGDGIAMAYRSGARVGNLEFYQFHPTLLYHAKINNFLLSESLRGEGAYLRLPDTEERFMARYEPKQMELATRDKVARAIFSEMERSSYSHVYLDIRHRGKDFIAKHFPKIDQTLLSLGLDMSKDLIPVVPGAHYWCGGILSDEAGKTDLQRLFALGETAFTGLHGANRLASNSLIEGVVMAHHAAKQCLHWLDERVIQKREIKDWDSKGVTDLRRASQITAHWRGLRGEMNSYAGIVRTEAGLQDLFKLIAARRQMIEDYYWNHTITRDLVELRNIALLSDLISRSALHRRESRGVHFREDFPQMFTVSEDTVLRFNEVYPVSRSTFEGGGE